MQRGLDWRWRSYGALAARVELLRGAVAEAIDRLPGTELETALRGGAGDRTAAGSGEDGVARTVPRPRVGFEDSGRPSAIALDLAVQAAGGCSVPLPAGLAGEALAAALAGRGCSLFARFEPRPGEASPPDVAVPAVLVPRGEPSEREAPSPPAGWAEGSVLVADGGPFGAPAPAGESAAEPRAGAGGPVPAGVEVPAGRVLAAAAAFAGRLAAAREAVAAGSGRRARRPHRAAREILLLPRPLHHPAGRLLAAWSLLAGAALVLEPDPEHRVRSAEWVRPTVFAGDPGEIAALRAAVGERRRRGLPLRRLHTLAVVGGAGGGAPLPEEERRFWAGRGTAVTVV